MARTGRWFMVIIVIILVIMGLNLSNHGINQLTMENRGAILDVRLYKGDIVFTALGKDYVYERDKVELKKQVYDLIVGVEKYFHKIWRIFNAVFLYDV